MNTIYDGTYVIGQTSATNFQAGPGISITQPSEGVVRIANDETVLFLHSAVPMSPTGTVYQMSEPITNFERIKVEYWNREFKYMRTTNEFFLEGTSANDTRFCTSLDVSVSTGNQQRLNMTMTYNTSGDLVDMQHVLFFANGGSVTTGNERGLGVHRVVGINRISGSNA